MKYFDLHCDTATALFDKNETLSASSCHVTDDSVSSFEKYAQVFAVFSKHSLGDEACFERFFNTYDHFKQNGFHICTSAAALEAGIENNVPCGILSIEDARLTSCEIPKLHKLHKAGVRLITPLWNGVTCIGGSFDTDAGLSDAGRKTVREAMKLGIVIDVSHASDRSTDEISALAEETGSAVLASHSNSRRVYPHPRNLTDNEAVKIKQLGGIIGLSLAPQHLTDGKASSEDVIRHAFHYLETVGEDALALGCDFDGIDTTPTDIPDQKSIVRLAEAFSCHGISDETINKIFFENAFSFFMKNLR